MIMHNLFEQLKQQNPDKSVLHIHTSYADDIFILRDKDLPKLELFHYAESLAHVAAQVSMAELTEDSDGAPNFILVIPPDEIHNNPS